MPYNAAINRLDMPSRMLRLKIDERGFPVPRFVEWIDGKPDFRVMDKRFMRDAISKKLCWLCGEKLGKFMCFVVGPMCVINRVSSEPPSHLGCARFAAKACPFLTQPNRKRDENNLPGEAQNPAGVMIKRNPGACALFITEKYLPFRAGNGTLINIGEPAAVEWYAHGRKATRDEVMKSIETGLPLLYGQCRGYEDRQQLDGMISKGMALVPG